MVIVTIDGNKNYKFNGNCNYCDKKGHKEADFRAKQRDNANNVEKEYALITTHNQKKLRRMDRGHWSNVSHEIKHKRHVQFRNVQRN